MTWFISTSDIIGLFLLIIGAYLIGSLWFAMFIADRLGLKPTSAAAWGLVALALVAYGAPIVFIGMAVLS